MADGNRVELITSQRVELSNFAILARVAKDYLWRSKALVGLALLGAIGVALTTGFLAWFIYPAVDLLFKTGSGPALPAFLTEHPLAGVAATILLAATIRFVAQRTVSRALNRLGNRIVGEMQSQLFSSMVRGDLERTASAHSAEHLSSILYDADLVRDAASTGFVQYVQAGLTVAATAVTMFVRDWSLSLIVVCAAPIIGFVMQIYLKRTDRAARGAMGATSALSRAVSESLSGLRAVKVASQEAQEESKINTVICERQEFLIAGADARSMAAPATEYIGGALVGGLLAYAGWQAHAGVLTAAGFLGFLTAFLTAMQALRQMTGLQGTFSQGMAAARRLFGAVDIAPSIREADHPVEFQGDVEAVRFVDVGFGYGDNRDVLTGVSFEVRKGEMVALVGQSGSGKSTVLSLLARLYDVKSGAIYFDGYDIRALAIRSLRGKLALVTQEPFLFDDTVLANIAYGNVGWTMADIEQAARNAAAFDFIQELPQGFATRVGERGCRLSGGQRQRIAIARAFLKNASVVLLDEVTAALDPEAEVVVAQAIERLMVGRVTIAVAHRLSTVRNANRILVFSHGSIIESGRHDELLGIDGAYAGMLADR